MIAFILSTMIVSQSGADVLGQNECDKLNKHKGVQCVYMAKTKSIIVRVLETELDKNGHVGAVKRLLAPIEVLRENFFGVMESRGHPGALLVYPAHHRPMVGRACRMLHYTHGRVTCRVVHSAELEPIEKRMQKRELKN